MGGPDRDETPFGPYTLVSPLGAGGMAEVFLAVKEGPMGFRKELAIKRIHRDVLKNNDTLLRALINEARLGGQLKHPNVVDTYEFGTVDDQHYIAMEYVDGLTLDDLLRGAARRGVLLPASAVLDLGSQLCDGLHYAHNLASPDGDPLGLIHRDLKPSNVIVSMAGQAKIMDFGIARYSAAMFKTTTASTPKGTLAYMSPEQVDDPLNIDHRSDLFALGAILFEALTGERLLKTPDDDARGMLFMLLAGKYRERLSMLRERNADIAAVVSRCLEFEREDRFVDAEELGLELRRIRETLGPELGCRVLMSLVGAARKGDDSVDSLRTKLLEPHDSSLGSLAGWHEFVASLSSAFEDEEDSQSTTRVFGGEGGSGSVNSSTTLSQPALNLAPKPATAITVPETAPPPVTATDAGGRRQTGLTILLVAALVTIGLLVWRPWDRGEAPSTTELPAVVVDEPVEAVPEEPTATEVEVATVEPATPVPAVEDVATPPSIEPPPPEEPSPAADLPPVRVVVNADPWASWVLSGDAADRGPQTPYVGELSPGSYTFTLSEPAGGASKTISVEVGSQPVSLCWSFAKDGPC